MAENLTTTRSGLAISQEREAWARKQVALMGLVDGGPHYDDALDAARRGFPAWRIAQSFGCGRDLIERLGGPPA